ncbi:head maturation protease, ClpP-related [Methylocella silvestris]|uniref:ATP-dependent Clp protease proteolytic subunit n=1 Tax=Methylocella silvestris TaxID=199596 RepID=A0A2J7TJR2_METSI|nr:head maturation protease, ClpP-related [Methylocella silvestris]PNG27012.1 peptidase S14 [Methylocella silvestris]
MTRALLNLLNANRGRGAGLRVVDYDPDQDGDRDQPGAPDIDGAATIYVYDAIGYGGVEAADAVKAIAAIKASRINLRINSPGGDVFEARAIKTALDQHPAQVTAYVDGLAASAASFLMLAGDEIQIAPGAFVMIHNAWGLAIGDAREMRATAQLLDQVTASIRNDYSARTGLDDLTIAKMMDDETWLEANDAVARGFATSLMPKPAKAAAQARAFDLSAYANAPKAYAERASDEAKAFAELEAARVRHEQRLRLYAAL